MNFGHFINRATYHLHNLAHSITHPRSVHWPVMRRHWLKEHGVCANPLCGSTKHLQVHHKKPYHLFPGLELMPSNFITLCMDVKECHLKIGHLGNWSGYNQNIDRTIESLKYVKQRHEEYEAAQAARRLTPPERK